MGVVKNKNKTKTKNDAKKNDMANGKPKKDEKVKKKKKVSCLQCFKSPDDGGLEGKYRVAAPELMQDTFMSDSEDEGGEVECPIQQQQQYRYMNSEAGTLHRARPLEDSVTDGHLWPSNNDSRVATIERQPLDIGFLVSFVVDARGGAMKAKRRGGVRIIVPPAACAAPTRVTCRAATRRAPAAAPPPLMEGEALASRLLELQPQGAKFLAPVVIEVPIFTASCPEREIVILRSDTGETWQDHYLHNNDNPMIQEALMRERQEHGSSGETLGESGERVTRIITCDFPHYLAVVSRVRQEVHIIGPEGGTVSSAHIPQVQALFPAQALTKRIRVGLQAHGAEPALARRLLPRHAAVSPVITVEPRRRKFHRSITLTAPLPQGSAGDKQSTSTLRLLCSIMGGQARAVWEDVTGSTPLTLTEDCASFTTTVSARFWLMNCQNVSDATKLATELYREMLLVPFEVRIVVLGKRLDALEGRLLVLYITDRYAYDTLLHQEHYTEVAHSTAVRFVDGKEVFLEFSGNLVPVTKSGSQPVFTFEAFKDNRVEFTVRVKHHEETPSGRIYFMNEPKAAKGEQGGSPACVLDVQLPQNIAPRAPKSHLDCLNLDQSGFDALKDELSFHWGDHNHSLGPASLPHTDGPPQLNGHDKTIANGDVKYPSKDTNEKDSKPQVNGDTNHVDSNKTKATFDSDEDKTPMNTLEKGKKKPEGGSFLGGLADKVKNVFSHSEEKEDNSKESSPKPQPKPRESSKEKSPPKPAPRLINEDLLDKVEDMFKDLHSKPHVKEDDDIDNKVYSTKLIVDEEHPTLHNITEEVYHQYEHMQPVDTPLHCKASDPFQFYDDCCKGKFKKGEKHRHEETNTLADRVEQVKFAAHEKLQEVSDNVENDVNDSLDKVNKEKDNLKQKTDEVKEEFIKKSDKVQKDLKDKESEVKCNIQDQVHYMQDAVSDKLNDISESAQKVQGDANAKATAVQSAITNEVENVKSSAQDTLTHLVDTSVGASQNLQNKAHELDFAARERAEQLRLSGQDKLLQFGGAVENTTDNLKNKAQETGTDLKSKAQSGIGVISESIHNVQDNVSHKVHDAKSAIEEDVSNAKQAVDAKVQSIQEDVSQTTDNVKSKVQNAKEAASEKLHNVQDDISSKAHDFKTSAQDKAENIKEATNEKINDFNESLNETAEKGKKAAADLKTKAKDTKDEVKSEAKKKAKEGKNFFTGLVHNIFGEKDKLEEEVKEKVSEGKECADKLLKQATAKKDEVEEGFVKKQEELKDGAEHIVQSVNDKKSEVQEVLSNKKGEIGSAISSKKDEIQETISNKKHDVEKSIQEKSNEAKVIFEDTKKGVEQSVQNKKDELLHARDSVQRATEDEMERIRQEAEQTTEEIKRTAEETLNAAADKKASLQANVTNKFEEIKESGKESLQGLQQAASNKVNDLQDSANDFQKSAKDSVNEFQQSATDRINDVQQSTKDAFGHAQDSTLSAFESVESAAKGKVEDAKHTWEDLQSSTSDTYADLKDDVRGLGSSAQDTLHSFQSSAGNTFDSLDESVKEVLGSVQGSAQNVEAGSKQLFGEANDAFEGFQLSAENKLQDVKGVAKGSVDVAGERLGRAKDEVKEDLVQTEAAVADALSSEADKFTSSLNDLGNSVFGSSGKGFMKDSSTKLLESEKSQSSPHKKGSGIPKLKRKNKK